jgi:hypothetical protein
MALQLTQTARSVIIRLNITSSEKTCDYITSSIQTAHGDNGKADMLTVNEFLTVSKYPVDQLHFNNIHHNLRHDMPVLVTDNLIERMGFAGNDSIDRRRHFLTCLKKCDPNVTSYTSHSYDDFCTWQKGLLALSTIAPRCNSGSSDKTDSLEQATLPGPSEESILTMYPIIKKDKHSSRRKFVVISCDLLQKMLMKLGTLEGDNIRDHLIACKKLLEIYMQYQTVYKNMQYRIDVDNMQRKMDTMIIEARDERVEANRKHSQLLTVLTGTQTDLAGVRDKLTGTQTDLAGVRDKLTGTQTELTGVRGDLAGVRDKLTGTQTELTGVRGELANTQSELAESKDDTSELADSVEALNVRITKAAPDHIHAPLTKALTHELLLYGNNNRSYRCIRTQRRSAVTAVKTSIALGYNRHVLTIPYAQGAINLWQTVKQSYTGATFRISKCTLRAGVEEADLITAINDANTGRCDI